MSWTMLSRMNQKAKSYCLEGLRACVRACVCVQGSPRECAKRTLSFSTQATTDQHAENMTLNCTVSLALPTTGYSWLTKCSVFWAFS